MEARNDDRSAPLAGAEVDLEKLCRADIEELARRQRTTILELGQVVQDQQQAILKLITRVRELEKQLGFDGPDPPSAATKPRKPHPSSTKKRKKRAKQFTRQRGAATKTVPHYPERCPDCDRALSGGTACWSREIIDFTPVPVRVTEHVMYSRWCGVCKKRVVAKAAFSDLVSGQRRFGHNLSSWIACLSAEGRVPPRTIQSILQRLYCVHISVGEIEALLGLVAKKGEGALEAIKEEIRSSDCKHADETGWRENGEYRCLWSISTALSRWFHIDLHRTTEVAIKLLGPEVHGTLVTDFLYSYNKIAGRHQRCWPHFGRDLDKLRLLHPNDADLHKWIDSVFDIWKRAREYRAFCLSKPQFGASVFDRKRKRAAFEKELYALAEPFLEADRSTCPQVTLAKRIAMFLSELFTFVEFPEVPDDNNAAERAIRPAVITRKVCGGTRSEHGSQVKAALLSLFGTWKAQGKDPIQECRALLISSP